jgi:colanic acid/amylovoran biosynthesis glycosyltransferase
MERKSQLKAIGAVHGQLMTTFYGYDISSYIKEKGTHIYDALFEKGNLFLCVSEQMKDTLIKLGCQEQKILVHRLGVHMRKLHLCLRGRKIDGKLRLLTIARLIEKRCAIWNSICCQNSGKVS